MSDLNTNLTRLADARDDIADAITEMGGSVGEYDGFEDFPDDIRSIDTGGSTFAKKSVASCKPSLIGKTYTGCIVTSHNWYSKSTWNVNGSSIWTDGTDYYQWISSSSKTHYKLDTSDMWISENVTFYFSDLSDMWYDNDGNLYYTSSSTYIFNKSTKTWQSYGWSGNYSISYGKWIWKDGEDIYYSDANFNRYLKLNKTNNSWEIVNISPFISSSIWTADGIAYATLNYKFNRTNNKWESITWTNAPSNFSISYIWTDGTNTYYSYGNDQYIIDTDNSTFIPKTWYGLTSFNGGYVWTKGDNIYYSNGSNQYILDKDTSTWISMNWYYGSNFTGNLYGNYFWSDGTNIYHSNGSTNYILDKTTNTLSPITFNGTNSFYGYYVWSMDNDIYYSNGYTHKILDKATLTWSNKTWTGLTNFSGNCVFVFDNDYYCLYSGATYKYDKSTNAWTQIASSFSNRAYGEDVWTDGTDLYCSYIYNSSTYQYKFDKTNNTWTSVSFTNPIIGKYVFTDGYGIYSAGDNTNGSCTYVNKNWKYGNPYNLSSGEGYYIWTDGDNIYYDNGTIHSILQRMSTPITNTELTIPTCRT